jgi:hypothetical protein
MRTRLLAVVALAAVVCLSACIDVESVVTVNKDGSGVVEETTLLSAQLSAMMAMAKAQTTQSGAASPASPDVLMTRDAADAKAKAMGPGVTVKSLEDVKAADGRQGQKVAYAFANIGQLHYDTGTMPNVAVAGTPSSGVAFVFSNGTLTVSLKSNRPAGGAPSAGGPTPAPPGAADAAAALQQVPMDQQIAMIKPMLAGMRVALRVKCPGGIASTDSTYVSGDTVTLLDVQVDKLLDNAAVLGKLGALSGSQNMSAADATQLLKGIPGVQVETKDTITIRLK